MSVFYSVLIGFVLDCLLGDPARLWHPVRLMGAFITRGEGLLRKLSCRTPRSEFVCGALLSCTLAALSFLAPFGLLALVSLAGRPLRIAAEGVMCWQMLAMRDLYGESMRVKKRLDAGDLEGARAALSMIVGRETAKLDERHVCAAAVETVAENASDGVGAPLLFMLIGGAPLAFLYKAVNTLDSMIGYRNDRYLYFGRFAARLDDVLNFIPARLTAVLMTAACVPARLDARGAARIFRRDRRSHLSPNSACTESVCAGALGVRLGGSSVYSGKVVVKPYIGDDTRPVEKDDIRRAGRLMIITSVLMLALGEAARALAVYAAARMGGM
jgi:adenosylcobinamide-phosphate synthase